MMIETYVNKYAELFSKLDRNIWNYEDGCVLTGLDDLYHAFNNDIYLKYAKIFIDRYIDAEGNIRKYDAEQYNLDFIPSGRVLFDLLKITNENKYRISIERLYSQIKNQPRTKCGSFWHKKIYPNQVWLDGLYMGLPFYMMYENNFGDGSHYDDIMMQFRNCRKYLYSEKSHLYYHAWCESKDVFWADPTTGCSPNFWLRSTGWHLMALADVYELMPVERTSDRVELASLLREATDGILSYQDRRTGLFFQLPTLPEIKGNYLETSGSLMVAYTLFKGYRLGILKDESYLQSAFKIMIGLELNKFEMHDYTLQLTGMCKGAGLGPAGNFRRDGSVAYYLSEPVVSDEEKGSGVCMMAYAEFVKAKKSGLLGKALPDINIYKEGYENMV